MRIFTLFILLLPVLGRAEALRIGDILLQPKNCYLCRLIEAHEGSSFSHMGIVIRGGRNPQVAESLGNVHVIPVSQFIQQGDLTRPLKVIRLKERVLLPLRDGIITWLGAEYDDEFLWDNFDDQGRERVYCSEFITKLLNPYLQNKIPTKIMDYTQNREAWWRYFNGNVPDGFEGNSPGDFEKSQLFNAIGVYQDGQWIWN